METYKNDYSKNEDEMLWGLHEIRNELTKALEQKTVEQINKEAREKFKKWEKLKEEMVLNA